MKEYAAKQPSPWVSVLPLAVLTLLLYVVIRCFRRGRDQRRQPDHTVCRHVGLRHAGHRHLPLQVGGLGRGDHRQHPASASAIIILLLIGAIAGSWMVSGVVPTMIYYGLKILHPSFFLVARVPFVRACR